MVENPGTNQQYRPWFEGFMRRDHLRTPLLSDQFILPWVESIQFFGANMAFLEKLAILCNIIFGESDSNPF